MSLEAVATCPDCGRDFIATWRDGTEGEVLCGHCGATFAASFPGWSFDAADDM